MWQDYTMMIGQWIGILALIPSLRVKAGLSKITTGVTAVVLAVFAYCVYTLGLTWSCVSFSVASLLWVGLFFKSVFGGATEGVIGAIVFGDKSRDI